MNILFLNHSKTNCGVHQYGTRLFDIIQRDTTINYIYRELDTYDDYLRVLSENHTPLFIIYNFHIITMSWLHSGNIQRKCKNVAIIHETNNTMFDIVIDIDPNTPNGIPRPIFHNIDNILVSCSPSTVSIRDFIQYKREHVPIFGSFGFGFDCKGFTKVVEMVQSQYDDAIIKFVIPLAHYRSNLDPATDTTLMAQKCRDIIYKPNITLLIIHEFFSNEELLLFLSTNTMNIFLYDTMPTRGISSVIDYALSVKTPLGISDSAMFRHIYSDSICLYKTSITDCIQFSSEYCNAFRNLYSHSHLTSTIKNILLPHFPHCSQSYQDYFVLSIVKHKQNGYFVEIGANHPNENNNTHVLYTYYNYRGLMVEYQPEFEQAYRDLRPECHFIIGDARTIEYKQFLDDNQYPKNIDYLQIDLDVDNRSTLDTLELFDRTVFDSYRFATVTFEHDIYRGDYFNTREKSREIFLRRGYILLFADVSVFWQGAYCPYEDWYVHPDLVDMEYIKDIISSNYVNYTCDQIKQILDKLHSSYTF